jgi:hypothetical protein
LSSNLFLEATHLGTKDFMQSQTGNEPLTLHLTGRLDVRLYSDQRPAHLETAALQKGLVLLHDGEELIEEGVGFGVPVVKYFDKTYFSRTAQTAFASDGSIQKTFTLDTISRKRFGKTYLNDGAYSILMSIFEKIYLKHKRISPLLNKLMEMRSAFKIKTEFLKVTPKGTVTVNYQCHPNTIKIGVDLSGLDLSGCEEFLVLNEQGANKFRKYQDPQTNLKCRKIGAWETVKAKQASLINDSVAFTVEKQVDATLFRGWELTKNRFCWAGLSYSIKPNKKTFNYTIKLTENQ